VSVRQKSRQWSEELQKAVFGLPDLRWYNCFRRYQVVSFFDYPPASRLSAPGLPLCLLAKVSGRLEWICGVEKVAFESARDFLVDTIFFKDLSS